MFLNYVVILPVVEDKGRLFYFLLPWILFASLVLFFFNASVIHCTSTCSSLLDVGRTLLAGRCRELLPVAEAPGPRVLSAEEQRRLAEQEENTLRELRLFLRDVTKRLATDKRFNIFSKPVDIEEV